MTLRFHFDCYCMRNMLTDCCFFKSLHIQNSNTESWCYLRRPKRVSSGSKFTGGRLWGTGEAAACSLDRARARDTRGGACAHIPLTCEQEKIGGMSVITLGHSPGRHPAEKAINKTNCPCKTSSPFS